MATGHDTHNWRSIKRGTAYPERVVPVQCSAKPCVGGVRGEPAGAKRGEFFNDPAVPVPARRDSSRRQNVAGGEPADPVGQRGPFAGGGRAVEGSPAHGDQLPGVGQRRRIERRGLVLG
jgi:hypothetical protein